MAADASQKAQIRTLLTVLGSGIVGAFLVAGFFLYTYGPSGQYQLKNALIEPALIPSLSYNDANAKTGSLTLFIYDGLEFRYYDPAMKQEKRSAVNPDTYERFYQSIQSDMSLLNPSESIVALFDGRSPTLQINVRTASHADWQNEKKVFQTVAFAGDYYRVKLHEESLANPWVYFYHPGIARDAFNLFIQP